METFINDKEKMRDFAILSKKDFLASYSYVTEAEYNATLKQFTLQRGGFSLATISNEQAEEEKVVEVHDADFHWCPSCKGGSIDYGETECESVVIYRVNTCNDCGQKWEERYDLLGVRIIEEGRQ